MQTSLRKKRVSAPQVSEPAVGAEPQGVAQLQRTIGNRQTGQLIKAHGPMPVAMLQGGGASRLQPKLRPSAKPAGQAIQRVPAVKEFENAKAAEDWYKDEKGELEANPLRKKRLEKATEYFLDSVESWKEFDEQALTVEDLQKDLVDQYNLTMQLEGLQDMVKNQMSAVNAKSAPLKELMEIIKPTSWLRSYATEDQINTMNTIKDSFKPAISSRDVYVEKLQPVLESIESITDLKDVTYKAVYGNVKKAVEKVKEEAPLSPVNEGYKEDVVNLKKDLDKQAKDKIKLKLEAARDDGAKQLDVEGAVPEIVTAIFNKELPADTVNTLITKALDIQHNPPKDLWLRKVVGLKPGLGGAYMKDIAQIDSKDAHVTRYADGVPEKPSVKTGAITLKNDILGNGVTAFHVTIETGGASHEKPHAYRGGTTLTRWDLYPQGGSAFTKSGDLKTALENSLTHQVNLAETAIDDTRTDMGKGLQKNEVRGWLKN